MPSLLKAQIRQSPRFVNIPFAPHRIIVIGLGRVDRRGMFHRWQLCCYAMRLHHCCPSALADDDNLIGVTDATRWAQRFVAVRHNLLTGPERVDIAADEDAMLGWFAAAIETGRMTTASPE